MTNPPFPAMLALGNPTSQLLIGQTCMTTLYNPHASIEQPVTISTRLDSWLARSALFGAVYAIIAAVLAHILRPDLNPLTRYLSEYAIGPYGWLMASAFIGLSVRIGEILFWLRCLARAV